MIKVKDMTGENREELIQSSEYRKFLRVVLNYADSICLTYSLGMKDFKISEWSFLNGSIINHEYTSHTPVTVGPDVLLLYLKIDGITVP